MAVPNRRPTVLVIDDEPLVRRVARRALEPDLYVLEAADGEDGLVLLDQHQAAIDLVVTDFMMPKISGLQVIAVLAEHRPELPVIGMTGHADLALRGAAATFGVRVLQKPFEIGALIASVQEVLAESRDGRSVSGRKRGGVGKNARGTSMASLVAAAEKFTLLKKSLR